MQPIISSLSGTPGKKISHTRSGKGAVKPYSKGKGKRHPSFSYGKKR